MGEFLQQVANGVSLGAIYALISLGYTMVYGVLRFVNFAHGEMFMLGAYLGMYGGKLCINGGWRHGWGLVSLVLLGSMAACALFGVLVEKVAYKPLREKSKLTVLITAIGVSLLIQYSGQLFFGATPQSFPEILKLPGYEVSGVKVSSIQVFVFFVTIVLLGLLTLIVMRTRIGLAMRALASNSSSASLMGINPDSVISFTFGLGSCLAGAGGVFYSMLYQAVDPFMGVLPGLKAFVAAVLGGIGVLPGAAIGGVFLGVLETLLVGYSGAIGIPSGYRDALAFVVLIVILLVRPNGLFGRSQKEKV